MKNISIFIVAIATASSAFSEKREALVINNQAIKRHVNHVSEKLAESWHLSTSDYKTYLDKMKSDKVKKWWGKIDPPQVLGMTAKTNDEMMKYARVDVQLDHERAEKEIKFQHAYNKAFDQLYPGAKIIKSGGV
jgi:integrating conjugative element protein (TIGR03759 family)